MRPTKSIVSVCPGAAAVSGGSSSSAAWRWRSASSSRSTSAPLDRHAGPARRQARELRKLEGGLHLDARRVHELGVHRRRLRRDRGLGHRLEARLLERLAERLGDQALLDLLGDLRAVELLEHGARRLAGPEAAHGHALGEVLVRAIVGALHPPHVDAHLERSHDGGFLRGAHADRRGGDVLAHGLPVSCRGVDPRGGLGAGDRSRTCTPFRAMAPKAIASASSATPALAAT